MGLKQLNFILSVFVMSVLFIACGSNKPIDTIERFYQALLNADRQEIFECFYIETGGKQATKKEEEKVDMLLTLMATKIKMESDKHGGFKNIEILSEEYQDDATKVFIKYKLNYQDGTSSKEQTSELIKIDGKWKIDSKKHKGVM